ncbi:MAG: Ig-like domain-containing protein, partial [Chitinophagales bacterium]
MKNVFLLNTFLFLSGLSFAQFSENFDDGDLAGWLGEVSNFAVDTDFLLQLQGDCDLGGVNYISYPVATLDSAVWEFYMDFRFDPTSANYARFYLQSDNPDLTDSLTGYYLRVGKDGGTDVAELYRQNGITATIILSGTSILATAPKVGFKVVRTSAAEWQLWIDPLGGTSYTLEGSVTDDIFNGGDYIGVYCKYSSTRCDLFYFDNFFVDPLYADIDAPAITSVTVLSSTQLEINFNENVELLSAEDEANYIVDGGVGIPINATRGALDFSKVIITFASPFPEAIPLTLTVSNIADESSNILTSAEYDFSFYTVLQYDVLITEIYADIEPSNGLPAGEYFELYNAAPVAIDLAGFIAMDETTESDAFPSYFLAVGEYVIVCDENVVDLFSAYPNVLAAAAFPAFNNDGDDLKLIGPNGNILHQVNYTLDWYNNAIKESGGWSLEMIDPSNPCQGAENWTASENPVGGTPGTINSVFAPNPDDIAPALLYAYPVGPDSVISFFDEALDLDNIEAGDFNFSGGIGSPLSLIIDVNFPDRIGMVLATALSPGIGYTLTVENVSDCSGNIINLFNTALLGLPEPAEYLD